MKDQQLVRDLWQKVEARMDCSHALTAFLTQKIDDCGQTVAFDAFNLVRQVLNPDGFVRIAHKSADQPLGSAITMPDSPWTAEGSMIDRQWDFQGTWRRSVAKWPVMNKYTNLKRAAIDRFCMPGDVDAISRDQHAKYKGTNLDLDKTYSMPALDPDQVPLDLLESLPDNANGKAIRRWEVIFGVFENGAYAQTLSGGTWNGKPKEINVAKNTTTLSQTRVRELFKALRKQYDDDFLQYCKSYTEQEASLKVNDINKSNRCKWFRLFRDYEHQNGPDVLMPDLDELVDDDTIDEESHDTTAVQDWSLAQLLAKNRSLEPYWRLSWRAGSTQMPADFGYNKRHTTCDLQDKPDSIIEVGYFCAESGLFSKRVIICEVDGDDKTDTKKKKAEVDDDGNEINTKKKDDPIKLALKLMTSTCAQNALQHQSYHIRANYTWYFDKLVDKSLLATTSIDLPEVADLMRLYGKDPKSRDYTTLHHAIHFMNHMFKAHVKIAFLIHMQVVHNIDVRTMDEPDSRMQDHCFFVNFEANYIPDHLTWQDTTSQGVRSWLEEKLMLHTRPQIKTYDLATRKSTWVHAPLLNASSQRSALHGWKAKITSARLPRYPYEKETCVPVVCASIQRVDMKKLVEVVRKAAEKSLSMYNEAIKISARDTYRTDELAENDESEPAKSQKIERREYPDYSFLTRKQQLDKTSWWNNSDDMNVATVLRDKSASQESDSIENHFGYEDPFIKRDFKGEDYKHWDQLDVRMHFFHRAIETTEWRSAADGVWYLQDYIDFLDMLRCLPKPSKQTRALLIQQREMQELLPDCPTYGLLNEHTDECIYMQPQTVESQRAYHMFSILSWFFDSRDAGACRWRWEDHVLQYFGAECGEGEESDFDKFLFQRKSASISDTKYFDNTWFLMTLFMEVNFRNAVAAIHYRLWDRHADTKSMTGSAGLQARAKELYNRQHSLLNTRARCAGLQGVSAGLSWKKSPQRNCLRNLLLSSLDDTLPELDPQLQLYLRQFNAPNAALFLRTIEVSNVLALHELALQHKLEKQTSASTSKLEARLAWFEPAVQSEIRYLLHSVERDDSVFTSAPVVHPTKAIVLEEELMRKWVRQTLGVHQHLHTLRCPLDVKFHMFTSPETYRVFMQLFCTKTQLDNSHTQRPVVFVLLQIYLAAWVLRGYDVKEKSIERDNPAFHAIPGRDESSSSDGKSTANHSFDPDNEVNSTTSYSSIHSEDFSSSSDDDENGADADDGEGENADDGEGEHADDGEGEHADDGEGEQADDGECEQADKEAEKEADGCSNREVSINGTAVPCVIGSSLVTWPLRDQNLWCKPARDEQKNAIFGEASVQPLEVGDLRFNPSEKGLMTIEYPDHQSTVDMTDDEQRRWLMLACARPGPCQYVQNYDGKFKAGEKLHEFTVQGCAVRQQPEYAHESTTGRQRDTMVTSVSHYEVSAEHRLKVVVCDDVDSYIFFEKIDVPPGSRHEFFPQYIRDIIPNIPRRTLIYVPHVFARNLRKDQIHDKLYTHAGSIWRMACVGYRAWAWKRLLVKRILFDALTNIVTRSPMLLSLFKYPTSGGQKHHIEKYIQTLEETKDTFGSMDIKKQKFRHATDPKRIQLTLSFFHRLNRVVEIEGTKIAVYRCSKMKTANRQVYWCQFLSTCHNQLPEKTSRFMMVDKRIHNALVNDNAEKIMRDGDVFQYRSYVYTKNEISSSVISFKGNLYVKFPSNYSVMQHGDAVKTGEVKNIDEDTIFATCFDCRTYNCMKPDYIRPVDSVYTMEVLSHHLSEKFRKSLLKLDSWRSTPSDDLDTSRYIYVNEDNRIGVRSLDVMPCLRPPTCLNWPKRSYRSMYSLPDFYMVQRLQQTDVTYEWVADLEYLNILESENKQDLMLRLRKSSRYIPAAKQDKDGKEIVTEVVDYTSPLNLSGCFVKIIMDIRRRIRPRPNDDDI